VGSWGNYLYCLNASTGGNYIWRFSAGGEVSSPVVVDGRVYVENIDANVYCVNASTGAQIWVYPAAGFIQGDSALAVAYNRVYVGVGNEVDCLDAIGNGDGTTNLLWYARKGDSLASIPSVADGKVYVGSNHDPDFLFYCLNASSGAIIWTYKCGTIEGSPAIADGRVYLGSDDHNVYCFADISNDVAATGITSSRSAVGQGYLTSINATVQNQGDFTETFNVTIYCNETAITLPDGKNYTTVTLTNGTSTTITFPWNTTDFPKGNYTIRAYAWPVQYETDFADNTCTGGSVQITKVGDLGSRVSGTNTFFAFDNAVTSADLQLFRECFKGTAPPEYMYLADLGSRVDGVNTFFVCDDQVTSADLQLFRQCYNGQGPPDP
jgi:hypothetical protein